MIEIKVYNDKCIIVNDEHDHGILPGMYAEAVKNELSYTVPSHEWSAKYKTGQWDGLISLYVKRTQSFPTGLTFSGPFRIWNFI